MRTQFNKGLSFASACIAIILFLLQSCVKTTFNDKNSREIIDEYKSTLYKDSDFIKNFQADRKLSTFSSDSIKKFNEQWYQVLFSDVSNAKTDNDLIAAFKKVMFQIRRKL